MRAFLIGGGRDPQEVQAAFAPFVAAAAGGEIVALVLDEGDATDVARWEGALRSAGADAVHSIVVSRQRPPTREDALTAGGDFVAGGRTPEYEQALVTAASDAWLEPAREAGAFYGGFSAGAAVAADEALVGGWKDVIDGRDYPVCAKEAGEDLGTIELRRGLGVGGAGVVDALAEHTPLEREDEAVAVHGAGLVHRAGAHDDGSVTIAVLAPGG